MKVVAYIDESGTHDKTGMLKGSSVIVIAGLVAWREEWGQFCQDWQAVLDKYQAPYFHFKEWSQASRIARGKIKPFADFEKNPYKSWGEDQLNEFSFELANIAGSGNKVIVGGWVNTGQFHAAKTSKATNPKTIPAGGDPYAHCLDQFFSKLPNDILSAWPYWAEPVSIFFDWSDNPEWKHAAAKAHDLYRQKDKRIGELTFADKKQPNHLPLQAADMVAYKFRQFVENFNNKNLRPLSRLDQRLLQQFGGIPGNPFLSIRGGHPLR